MLSQRFVPQKGMHILMGKATKDMMIGELLQMDAGIAGVLVGGGMHCVGCPSAQGESLEEAAFVHGIDPELLLAKINAYLESKQT